MGHGHQYVGASPPLAFDKGSKPRVCKGPPTLRGKHPCLQGLSALHTKVRSIFRSTILLSMTTLSPSTVHSPFYARLHHAATKRAGFHLMNQWQAQHHAQGKRGGVNEVTKSLFNVLVSKVLPASMQDLAKSQPEVYQHCLDQNQFFLFTTTKSLITLLSKEYTYLKRCTRTIRNHLNLLLKTGVFVEKINHTITGWRNPLPSEENPKGRGKIKLVFAAGLVHTRAVKNVKQLESDASFFAHKEQTLPQYTLSKESAIPSIGRKELKSINNTVHPVDKLASPIGESMDLSIENIEQGSKSDSLLLRKNRGAKFRAAERVQKLRQRAYASDQDQTAQYLYQLLRKELYEGKAFNELTRQTVLEGLKIHMGTAAQAVDAYRQKKIKDFKDHTTFLSAKRRARKLSEFQKTLPKPQLAVLEILAHAIEKQRKYAQKYNWTLWYPAAFIHSKAAQTAVELSIEDWLRIHKNYFERNLRSRAWAKHTQWINATYAKRVQQAQHEGVFIAQQTAMQLYQRWAQRLEEESYLSVEQRTQLVHCFLERIRSLTHDA